MKIIRITTQKKKGKLVHHIATSRVTSADFLGPVTTLPSGVVLPDAVIAQQPQTSIEIAPSPLTTAPPDGYFHTWDANLAPSLQFPPDGWETRAIPAGALLYTKQYQTFFQDVEGKLQLNWAKSGWFLPALPKNPDGSDRCWKILQLQEDNTRALIYMLEADEPIGYTSIDSQDGLRQSLDIQAG